MRFLRNFPKINKKGAGWNKAGRLNSFLKIDKQGDDYSVLESIRDALDISLDQIVLLFHSLIIFFLFHRQNFDSIGYKQSLQTNMI